MFEDATPDTLIGEIEARPAAGVGADGAPVRGDRVVVVVAY